MSIRKELKTCPFCGKRYRWNPDVGRMFCPYCKDKPKSGTGAITIGTEGPLPKQNRIKRTEIDQ